MAPFDGVAVRGGKEDGKEEVDDEGEKWDGFIMGFFLV